MIILSLIHSSLCLIRSPRKMKCCQRFIERKAFPIIPRYYTHEHPNLRFLTMSDGAKLACMMYEKKVNEEKANKDKIVVLYSHGNRSDIGYNHKFLSKLIDHVPVDEIISYDYPGYGLTEGKTTEEGCI